jgi:hypothetical protein
LQIYFIFARICIFARFCEFQKLSQKESAKESAKRREPIDVNEGKFVLNIDFIMALKPDGLCVYETTVTREHIILIPFFIISNFLNKKESKVICKREFEIILLQTHDQSLSIKPFN